jgi:hypothetical protein
MAIDNQPSVQHKKQTQSPRGSLADALNYLNRLIDNGTEFPDAIWRTSQCYPRVSLNELTDAYDSQ